ncbi:MAG: GWxTD domain-containing protein, partial [Acidobacteriota bacterium]
MSIRRLRRPRLHVAAARGSLLVALVGLALSVVAAPDDDAPARDALDDVAVARAVADDAPTDADGRPLPPRHARWLADADALLSETERTIFLGLRADYQRDHFIRMFWRLRDPFPETGRNEFQERWTARVGQARALFDDLAAPQARMLLRFGAPTQRQPRTCDLLRPLEIWRYPNGTAGIDGTFTLVFIGFGSGARDVWRPTDGVRVLLSASASARLSDPRRIAQRISEVCGGDLVSDLALAVDLVAVEQQGGLIPQVDDEWALAFRARGTDLPDDAAPLDDLQLDVRFPGRHQMRTIVQGIVGVPVAAAPDGG